MSFSYSANPAASNLDYVRFKVGDTDSASFYLHDAEITAMITEGGNKYVGAVKACEGVIAKLARQVNTKVGPTSVDKSDRVKAYERLLVKLQKAAAMQIGAGALYVGGISDTERETDKTDTDLIQPMFDRQFDRPSGISITGETE